MISGSRIWRERENILFDARQWRTARAADRSLRHSQISDGRTRRFGRIRFGLNFFEHILRAPPRGVALTLNFSTNFHCAYIQIY